VNRLHDNSISLEPENHRYILKDDPDFKFLSSTRFVHGFFEPFDREAIATKLVGLPKYAGFTKEDLFNEWTLSATIGTKIHEELEIYVRDSTPPGHKKSIVGVEWLTSNIPDSCKLYPEVSIYSKEIGMAGTIDLLVHNTDNDKYTIIDWKTNKKIHKRAYKGKTGTKSATMDMEDCNFNHYTLQLSLYGYILETYYNLDIKNLYLVHLKEDQVVLYDWFYMKRTIKEMLKSRKI